MVCPRPSRKAFNYFESEEETVEGDEVDTRIPCT